MLPTTVAGVDVGTGMSVMQSALAGVIDVVLDFAEVAKVQTHLDEAQQALDLARSELRLAIPASTVGGSPVGKQLSHHSGLADQALLTTLEGMEQTIVTYRTQIETFLADMQEQDENAAATGKRGTSKVETGDA